MFKYLVVLSMMLAVAFAAPQILIGSSGLTQSIVVDHDAAQQLGLPGANGWTDGPNNGLGPQQVIIASSPVWNGLYAAPLWSHSGVQTVQLLKK